jgi:hypothetical protein
MIEISTLSIGSRFRLLVKMMAASASESVRARLNGPFAPYRDKTHGSWCVLGQALAQWADALLAHRVLLS